MTNAPDSTSPAAVITSAPIPTPVSLSGLSLRSVSVVKDSVNRAPSGLPLDIVELELVPPDGAVYMRFRDLVRIDCERGSSAKVLAALGIKAPA